MEQLKERIIKSSPKKDGKIDVGHYLNRMLDPTLLEEIAEEFAKQFPQEKISRVLTMESAGIGIALMTAQKLGAKALYANRNRTKPEQNAYIAEVSGTRAVSVSLPKRYLSPKDKVLIVDDFIGVGNATNALVELVRQSGAQLVGVCAVIERTYLGGGDRLRARGIKLHFLLSVSSEDKNGIVFD